MLNKFFRYAFGVAGDKSAIPDATQASGAVSYQQAYGPQYELPYTDPNARDVERQQNNQLHYDITTALQEYQTNGVPDWIDPAQNGGVAYAYPILARVRYSDGRIYFSATAANTSVPGVSANWLVEAGRLINVQLLAAVGAVTYTPTIGTKSVIVEGVGGGGAGAGSPATGGATAAIGGGGSAGSYFKILLQTGFAGGVIVTNGAGGAANVGASGGVGGATSFGAIATAPGGIGAAVSGLVAPPLVAGGAPSPLIATASPGVGGIAILLARGYQGQHGVFAANGNGLSGAGGFSLFGPGGSSSINGGGNPGVAPGSGGSGGLNNFASAANAGGAGVAGQTIVWEFA